MFLEHSTSDPAQHPQQLLGVVNIAANLVLGLLVVWVGMQLAKWFA